jgi:glycine dehydrogenase
MKIVVGPISEAAKQLPSGQFCGILVQYPDTYGSVSDWTDFVNLGHKHGALLVAATDLLASTLLKPAGEMGIFTFNESIILLKCMLYRL